MTTTRQDIWDATRTCALCSQSLIGGVMIVLDGTGRAICPRHLNGKASTIPDHAVLYPECPTTWHDLWDHNIMRASANDYRAFLAGEVDLTAAIAHEAEFQAMHRPREDR